MAAKRRRRATSRRNPVRRRRVARRNPVRRRTVRRNPVRRRRVARRNPVRRRRTVRRNPVAVARRRRRAPAARKLNIRNLIGTVQGLAFAGLAGGTVSVAITRANAWVVNWLAGTQFFAQMFPQPETQTNVLRWGSVATHLVGAGLVAHYAQQSKLLKSLGKDALQGVVYGPVAVAGHQLMQAALDTMQGGMSTAGDTLVMAPAIPATAAQRRQPALPMQGTPTMAGDLIADGVRIGGAPDFVRAQYAP
jgi:hypothetical protein